MPDKKLGVALSVVLSLQEQIAMVDADVTMCDV